MSLPPDTGAQRARSCGPEAPSDSVEPAGQPDPDLEVGAKVYLRLPDVLRRYGCSRASVYAWISVGHFPAPTRLGPRLVAWPSDELARWEATRPH